VLVRHLPAEALTASERRTVEELVELRDEVERAKREFREEEGGASSGVDIDRFLANLGSSSSHRSRCIHRSRRAPPRRSRR
jgi:hypothetical protein